MAEKRTLADIRAAIVQPVRQDQIKARERAGKAGSGAYVAPWDADDPQGVDNRSGKRPEIDMSKGKIIGN